MFWSSNDEHASVGGVRAGMFIGSEGRRPNSSPIPGIPTRPVWLCIPARPGTAANPPVGMVAGAAAAGAPALPSGGLFMRSQSSKLWRRVLAGDPGDTPDAPPRLSLARARRLSSPYVAARKARRCRSASSCSANSNADFSLRRALPICAIRCRDPEAVTSSVAARSAARMVLGPAAAELGGHPKRKVWSMRGSATPGAGCWESSTLPRWVANVGFQAAERSPGPVHAP